MGNFLFSVVEGLLEVIKWVIIVSAILSWLVAFDVINLRNPRVRQIVGVLDRIIGPVLAPFRRIIPPFGGLDITPIIALIVIQAAQTYLVPWLFGPLIVLLRG